MSIFKRVYGFESLKKSLKIKTLRSEASIFHSIKLQEQHHFTKTLEEQSEKPYFSILLNSNSLLFSLSLKYNTSSKLGGRATPL